MKKIGNIIQEIIKQQKDGKLPKYTSFGCYPILYLDFEDNILCPDCANNEIEKINEFKDEYIGSGVKIDSINWEDNSLYCDECSQRIESAYNED